MSSKKLSSLSCRSVSSNASTKLTAVAKSIEGDWSISDKNCDWPSIMLKIAKSPIKVRSSCARSVEKCRKKWKYLRERENSGSGAAGGSRRWKYISILNFLETYITDRDTSNFRQNMWCDEDVSVVALLESIAAFSPQNCNFGGNMAYGNTSGGSVAYYVNLNVKVLLHLF